MASVGSVSGSSSAFYNNKISGLASGMDTESIKTKTKQTNFAMENGRNAFCQRFVSKF